MVRVIAPRIGETIYDGACGSAGFLCESHDYLRYGGTPGNAALPICAFSGGNNTKNTKNANQEIGDPSDPRGWFSRGYLPHYDGASVIQHVTAHLADSLPKAAIEKMERSLAMVREERRKIERQKRVQAWIDAGYGCCILRHPDIAAMMQNTFLYFNNTRYRLHAWVVMPNPFHVLVEPLNGWLLSKIVASWKKFSAKKILEYARMADVEGGADAKANREYWDRYIRNERHYEQAVAYIHNNPVAAGLVKVAEAWPWSSARGLKV